MLIKFNHKNDGKDILRLGTLQELESYEKEDLKKLKEI